MGLRKLVNFFFGHSKGVKRRAHASSRNLRLNIILATNISRN